MQPRSQNRDPGHSPPKTNPTPVPFSSTKRPSPTSRRSPSAPAAVIAVAIKGDEHIGQLVEHTIHIPEAPNSSSPSSKPSPPTPRLPHHRTARLRRRSVQKFGEERYSRVERTNANLGADVRFSVIPWPEPKNLQGKNECYLVRDNWNDFGFKTLFHLIFFDLKANRLDIGRVKIVQVGTGGFTTQFPHTPFSYLAPEYISLGQDQSYYETIRSLAFPYREAILGTLRDMVYLPVVDKGILEEEVCQTSLLRGVNSFSIQSFAEILSDDFASQPYAFSYRFPGPAETRLTFNIQPGSAPPTNIHVLIGRNGVGKTHLLSAFSRILRGVPDPELGRVEFSSAETGTASVSPASSMPFANLIKVAFSAFDDYSAAIFGPTTSGIRYEFVGLNRTEKDLENEGLEPQIKRKTLDELNKEFSASALVCCRSARRNRWIEAMRALESDPVFANMHLANLAEDSDLLDEKSLSDLFTYASSGHKIVLLTITRLIELVDERTVVIIDEPEAHLHPPLQSTFVRVLSSLLSERNGVALIASHSPVMLQEVPRECVWILQKFGSRGAIARPTIETFGENVGILTREVFKLEVTESGFHSLLRRAISESDSLDEVFRHFENKLGAEARAVAAALWKVK